MQSLQQLQLSEIVDHSPGIILFSLNKEYRYTYFTQSHAKIMQLIWGVNIHDNDCILDFLSPLDREKAKKNFDEALSGISFTKIEEYGSESLQRSWWESRYDPLYDVDKSVVGVVIFVIDISRFVKASSDLELAQTRLSVAMSATRTGVWDWNIKTNHIFWSDEVYELFHQPKSDHVLAYADYVELIHPQDRDNVIALITRTIEGLNEYEVEHRILTKDGKVRWIYVRAVVSRDTYGNAERMVGLVQDITEKKVTEKEKHDWQVRYELLVKSSGQIIYEYNLTTGKVLWRGNTLEVLGVQGTDISSFDFWASLIHPDDRERVLNHFNQCQRDETKFDVEYRFETAGSVYKFFSDRGFFSRTADNEVVMLGVMEDITVSKTAQQALQQKNDELTKANRELDKFVYSASHDLRAPISSLLGLIKVARLETSVEKINDLLAMQERTLKKLDVFIKDIVDHSRNARMEVLYEKIDLRLMIDDVFEQFYFFENLKHIAVEVKVNAESEFVSDARRLHMILNNLISNAIKYADVRKENPFIKAEVNVSRKEAIIQVSDNGEGVKQEWQPKIFDMFFRASERSSGSGLGLYIVREVVYKLGGQLSFTSTYGQGTCFIIHVPNHYKA